MAAPPVRPDPFRLDMVEPAYLVLHRDGRLADRAAAVLELTVARKPSPPRQPRPAKTGWDWRRPPAPKPRRPPRAR